MTFRPYAWKIRLGNTENFLDIDDLTDGYLLWRNGSKVTSTLIDQGKLSLSAPQNPNDAATKQYVDDNLTADESARVAADIHLQAQIDALMGTSLTSGDKGDITIAADGYAWNIDAGAVTNAKLAAVGSGIIKGRASAGTGAVEDLTGTQATALLDVFSTEAKGLVPAAASGGTTNFLRADGVWAAPPAGTVTGVSVVSANGLAGTVANSGTTPAITLSTSVSGVLKGSGTAISAAISGTDFAPATSGTSILAGDGSGGFSNVTVGSGLALENGTLAATASSSSVISVTEGSAPAATAGVGKLWANSAADARPYWIDDTGQVLNLTFDRFNTLAPGASVAVDLSPALPVFNSLSLNGNTAFTTTNLGPGRSVSVRVVCDGTDRNLTFPETWRWLGSGPPSALPANGIGYLSITAFGNTDGDVLAGWSYETVGDSFGLTDGDKGDITVASSGAVWTIDSGSVTNDKLANVATATFKGRTTAGTGAVEDMTGTQATALLDVFTTTAKGLVPVAAGGGTTNFLRADGYWAAPPAGTVTDVSVVSANGLAGTVANSGTTPAITLSTSVTGVLKGNGTAISAAVSGTDYAPATSGTAILKGNGAGGFSNAAAGTDYAPATSGTSILYGNNSGGFSNVTVGTGLTFSAGTLSSNLVGVTDGDKGDITVASTGTSWTIDSGVVTNAKLANVATATIKGRTTAGTGAVEDLTGTQATALLDTFTTAAKGLVPAATGGGTTNFLRADGTWAAPPAGTVTSVSVVSANGLAGTVANATTTPAITLSTSVTGLLQGNGTAISAATIGTGLSFAGGTLSNTQVGLTDGDKGDITVASSGASWTIDSGAVSNSKLANVAAATIKGRATAGTGAVEDLTGTQATALLDTFTTTAKGLVPAATGGGSTNFLRADGYWAAPPAGTVTDISVVSANGLAGTVANSGTTPAITLSTSVTGLLKGNGTAISAAVSGTDYAPATSGTSLLYGNGSGGFSNATVGASLAFASGTLSRAALTGDVTATANSNATTIANNAVTNAKLADMATSRIKGRVTASTGDPEDLTGTQVTTLLDAFTSTLKGLAPASGGGTSNFLRADGTWVAPPNSGGTVTSVSVVSANGLAGTVANATTTPAITLSTSITGLLKGNGTAISAAVAGTDYAIAGNYVTTDTAQTITAAKAIDIADDVAPALRITQRGKGEALRVEDSTNIDSSPFVIDSGGNVGVGTAAPGAKLHVSSGSDGWAKWEASVTSSSYMSFIKGGTSTEVGYIGTDGGGILAGETGDNFGIRSENDLLLMAGSAERARITGDGRVGIATTSPGAMLDINTSGATSVTLYSAEFQSSSGTTNAGRVLFSQGSTYAMAIAPAGTSATTGRIDFQYITRSTGAVSTTPLSLRGDGNVGIGTQAPSKRLHISGSGLLIDGASSVESAPLAARLIVDSGASTGHTLADLRNNNGSTLFVGGTNVGIGTSSPSASNRLTVSASTNNSLASIAISNTYAGTGTWEIAVPGTGKVLSFSYNGTQRGYLSNSVNVSNIDFTGQHRSVLSGIDQPEGGGIGLIVVAAGDYQSLSGANRIDINEALPRVTLSSARNQKSVFGVISDREDDNSSTREYWVGNFVNVYDKAPGDNRLVINSLGEGAIWICNINGNLENGDFITSCEVPGYGMRQDDDLMHNYTVAKITCDCDFDLSSTDYICQEFEFNGTVYRKAFVGCTYHCG